MALDSTWYDLQDMGSLGTRIVVAADGRVHVTWQDDFCELDPNGCPPNLNLPQPHPFRGMAYAYCDALGAWQPLGKVQDPDVRNCCVTELFGGFGGLDVTPGGRAVVAQHMNEEGCDLRGNFYLEDAAGATTWAAQLTPITSPSYLFPQVLALPNGSFDVLAEVPRGGSYDETERFAVSRFASGSTRFVCPTGWQGGAWTTVISPSLFRDGRGAFPCIARGADGPAALAAAPNPARAAVSFSLASGGGGVIEIFGVDGRRVARLPLRPGAPRAGMAVMNMAAQSRTASTLARLEGRAGAGTKFLMMR